MVDYGLRMDSCYVHMVHQVHQVIQQRSKYDVVNYFHICEVNTVNIIVKINITASYYKTLWQNILIYRIDNYAVHSQLQVHVLDPLLVASWPQCMLHITVTDWFRVQANNNSDTYHTLIWASREYENDSLLQHLTDNKEV